MNDYPPCHVSITQTKVFEERETHALMNKLFLRSDMVAIKEIIAALIGLLILASLVGYSGQEDIPNVPKPGAGLCGVTKDSFDNIPGSGLLVDIEVDVSWDDSEVWIGIITVEDYDSLEKLGENSEGELVPCDSKIDFVAGGPSSGSDSKFNYIPDGEEFHIMIGSLNDAEDEDDDDDSIIPGFVEEKVESNEFVDEFNVKVEYEVSGGLGIILILIVIELVLLYYVLLNRTN